MAFVGRCSPLGAIFASFLLSLFHIGGELAQSRLALPKSITMVFEGLLLFSLLASDTLIYRRLRWSRSPLPVRSGAAPMAAPDASRAAPGEQR